MKKLIPEVSFYNCHGEDLKHFNCLEHQALVLQREKKLNGRVKEYDIAPGHIASACYTQCIGSKVKTVIVTWKAPPHPGPEPRASLKAHADWKKKADEYAKCYLYLFHPEVDCYLASHIHDCDYTWDAFVSWIEECQQDDSITSKFRLMSMHNRMKGFNTNSKTKAMTSSCYARSRHMWDESERKQFAKEAAYQRMRDCQDRLVADQMNFGYREDLSVATNKSMLIQTQCVCV